MISDAQFNAIACANTAKTSFKVVIGAAYTKVFLSLYYKYLTNVCHMFKIVIRRVSLRGMELYINNENADVARETANYMYFLRNDSRRHDVVALSLNT